MTAVLTYPVDEAEVNEMIEVLKAIQLETMDFPPVPPVSCDSYLPADLVYRIGQVLEKVEAISL